MKRESPFPLTPGETPEEKSKREKLEQSGGVFFHEGKDGKKYVNVMGQDIETFATKEEVERIMSNVELTDLDRKILSTLSMTYKLNQAVMFEGPPGAGKTFGMETFIKIIFGENAPINSMMGSPKTSEFDIIGQWVPKEGGKEKLDDSKLEEVIKEYKSKNQEDFDASLEPLKERYSGIIDNFAQTKKDFEIRTIDESQYKVKKAEYDKAMQTYHSDYFKLADQALQNNLSNLVNALNEKGISSSESEWEFKEGPLLRSYTGYTHPDTNLPEEVKGNGYPLIVDEFNNIPANYQQIFLHIGGSEGGLSDAIHVGGKSYKRGKHTGVFMAANFPERTEGRSDVPDPMTDRIVWTVLTEEEALEKKKMILTTGGGKIEKVEEIEGFSFTGDEGTEDVVLESGAKSFEGPLPMDQPIKWNEKEVFGGALGVYMGQAISELHLGFENKYPEWKYLKTAGTKDSEGQLLARSQNIESSPRRSARLIKGLLDTQFRDDDGKVDLVESLLFHFQIHYVNCLGVDSHRAEALKLFTECLNEVPTMMVKGKKRKLKYEGREMTNLQAIQLFTDRMYMTESEIGVSKQEMQAGSKKDQKEMEEKKKIENEEEKRKLEREEKASKQAERDYLDAKHRLLTDPDREPIPEIFKDVLEGREDVGSLVGDLKNYATSYRMKLSAILNEEANIEKKKEEKKKIRSGEYRILEKHYNELNENIEKMETAMANLGFLSKIPAIYETDEDFQHRRVTNMSFSTDGHLMIDRDNGSRVKVSLTEKDEKGKLKSKHDGAQVETPDGNVTAKIMDRRGRVVFNSKGKDGKRMVIDMYGQEAGIHPSGDFVAYGVETEGKRYVNFSELIDIPVGSEIEPNVLRNVEVRGVLNKILFDAKGDTVSIIDTVGIRIYSCESLKDSSQELQPIQEISNGSIEDISYSQDGTMLIAKSKNQSVEIYSEIGQEEKEPQLMNNISKPKEGTLGAGASDISSFQISPNNEMIVVSRKNGEISLYSLKDIDENGDPKEIRRITATEDLKGKVNDHPVKRNVESAIFSPDGKFLYISEEIDTGTSEIKVIPTIEK